MFKRSQFSLLKSRITEPRRFIQVLSGPRQIGKTTLVRQLTKELEIPILFTNADGVSQSDTTWLAQQWEGARLQMDSRESNDFLLIIDEIQQVHNWSAEVKKQWDKDSWGERNLKVILLGSSSLLIQKGLTESLAGRFERIGMSHWSFAEMEEAFGFSPEEYVWYGGYPGAAELISEPLRWEEYVRNAMVETTISKDILMLAEVRKPALLRRLFELGASFSGQILSYTKMIGQLQDAGNTTTLAHYLQLLETAGLLTGLEKLSSSSIRTRASSPRFQVLNNALMSIYSNHSLDSVRKEPETWGRHVESAIGAHLANAARTSGINLFYWRERNDEVDFVLEYKGQVIGIEVKSGSSRKAKGMAAFQNKFSPDKMLLVGSDTLPWQDFLKIPPINLF
ncbi:MAG: ATP-binding protein [Bacteroidia bacterium]